MKIIDRSRVLVLGDWPVDPEPFDQRHLTLRSVTLSQLEDVTETNTACGVLIAAFPGKQSVISSYFQKHFRRICESGLITIIRVDNKKDRDLAYTFRNGAY